MAGLQAPTAYQTKSATIADTAVAISAAGWSWTSGNLELADQAVIAVKTAPVVMTWDGTTPTSAVGLVIPSGGSVVIQGNDNVQAIRLVRQGASNGTVSITLERYI